MGLDSAVKMSFQPTQRNCAKSFGQDDFRSASIYDVPLIFFLFLLCVMLVKVLSTPR